MAYQGAPQGHQSPGGHDHHPRLSFSSEELKVLRECNRESFYYRCMPFAAIASAATFMAMRGGYLSVSKRFGYTPKILGASFIGYFMGKFSYQSACAEKLMQLPDSPVGEALRRRKGRLGFQETLGMEAGFGLAQSSPEAAPGAEPIFDDHRPDQRDHSEALDDYQRGVTDSLTPYAELPASPPQHSTSYQELRRQNREEYMNRMAERYRKPPSAPTDGSPESPYSPSAPPLEQPSQPPYKPSSSLQQPVRKNQYGDDVYE